MSSIRQLATRNTQEKRGPIPEQGVCLQLPGRQGKNTKGPKGGAQNQSVGVGHHHLHSLKNPSQRPDSFPPGPAPHQHPEPRTQRHHRQQSKACNQIDRSPESGQNAIARPACADACNGIKRRHANPRGRAAIGTLDRKETGLVGSISPLSPALCSCTSFKGGNDHMPLVLQH